MFLNTRSFRRATSLTALTLIVVLALAAASSSADTWLSRTRTSSEPDAPAPLVLHYQGRLADPTTGAAKPDGTYQMVFALYDVESGGSPLWVETRDVSVRGGLFSVRLGEVVALPAVFDGRALWLGITVGGDPQATPRLPVSFVAYAFYANRAAAAESAANADLAANANRLGGLPPASYAAATHTHDAGAIASGTLSTDRFSAYADLVAEGKIGAAAGMVAAGLHVHTGADIVDGSIGTADLADGSVTSAKIADGNVTPADLAPNSVDSSKIVDGSVGTADLANNSVTTAKISPSGGQPNHVIQYTGSGVAWGYAPGSVLRYTVLNVNCTSVSSFGTTPVKILNIGSFTKIDAASRLEITFNGRIYAASVTGTGAIYELRVDDTATTNGRARANLRAAETGGGGQPVSITGIFDGFGAGTRTVSLWVWTSQGTGTSGMVDPGCWSTDHVVVREVK